MVEQQHTTGIACLMITAREGGGLEAASPKAAVFQPPEACFNYPERHSLSGSIAIMSPLWE